MDKLLKKLFYKYTKDTMKRETCLIQVSFDSTHSTILQCMGLRDRVTLNFNGKMSTATAVLAIEEEFDIILHRGLLYKLQELEFSTN
jgi:hypothetical protein